MQAVGTYATYLQSETLRVVTPYLLLGALALLWGGPDPVHQIPRLHQRARMFEV